MLPNAPLHKTNCTHGQNNLGLLGLSTLQAFSCCCHNASSNTIRITICRRSAIFHITPAILFRSARNADRRSAISNTIFELVDAASLMFSSEALVIPLAILCNVLLCFLAEGPH